MSDPTTFGSTVLYACTATLAVYAAVLVWDLIVVPAFRQYRNGDYDDDYGSEEGGPRHHRPDRR